MNTGQPSKIELSAADAKLESSCCMLYPAAPGVLAPGIEDSNCLLSSSSVKRMGSTQLLYQEQARHCTNAWASSRISLMLAFKFLFLVSFNPLSESVRKAPVKLVFPNGNCRNKNYASQFCRASRAHSVSVGTAVVLKVPSADTASFPALSFDLTLK